ncbi:hypothetical protein DOS84_04805 [Flavobacterium aquariorum]|uniref:O-antigen ligase domain-containing protein n=1 Tax=Flavobacterium aquariorum TaxID=2217670 RepID=A0A2W7UNC7_9FLAO|nr:hypothetical protein DOS84_04805 [Flavobacterium aquariorum]
MLSNTNQKLEATQVLLVFFSTLLSFYFPSLGGIRLFDIFSFLILIFITKTFLLDQVQVRINNFFLIFTYFILISFIITLINNTVEIHFTKFIGTFFTIIYSLFFFNYFKDRSQILFSAVNVVVYIHAAFFYIQYLTFYLFGAYIDFIKPITGNDSRNIAGQFNLDTSLRFSGLFSEAAAYSLFILTFFSIVIIGKKRLNLFDFGVLLTIPLSTSASGTVYLLFFLLIYFLIHIESEFYKKAINAVLFLFTFIFAFYFNLLKIDYLKEKIIGFQDNSSYLYRVGNIDKFFSLFNENQILFGIGYTNMDIVENKGSTFSALFVEHGIILGGIFLISILLMLHYFKVKYYIFFLVLLLFMGTYMYSQIQFWVWILSVCILSFNNQFAKDVYYNEKAL